MSTKKYEMTDETIIVDGHTLHRIRALRDIPEIGVLRGMLGGFIEKEGFNLSQYNNSWVFDNAKVYDRAKVFENATVRNNAEVFDTVRIYDNATVRDNAMVFDSVIVCNNAVVRDNAVVGGKDTYIHTNDVIQGNERVYETINIWY